MQTLIRRVSRIFVSLNNLCLGCALILACALICVTVLPAIANAQQQGGGQQGGGQQGGGQQGGGQQGGGQQGGGQQGGAVPVVRRGGRELLLILKEFSEF